MSGSRRFADFRPRGNARHRDGKAGTLAQCRRQTHRMVEQPAQPVNNGEPETEAGTTVVTWCAKAIEFAEDVLLLVLRNSRSGIPNLDMQIDAPLAATDEHAATASIAYRIRNQIENDALQQDEVAAHPRGVRNNAQRKSFFPRGSREGRFDSVEQFRNRKFTYARSEHAGVELGYVQERVKQFVHCGKCRIDASDYAPALIRAHPTVQLRHE